MAQKLIPLEQHPENNADSSSVLINPHSRPGREIFKHRAGYLATFNGLAFSGLFDTESEARDAQLALEPSGKES